MSGPFEGARSQPPSRLVWAALAVSFCVAAGFQVHNIAASYRELGLLDLQVYRMGGQALLDRAPLYQAIYPHDALPFTYPPFAALAFIPFALLGWSGGAMVMTLASVAALARMGVLVLREAGSSAFPVRWSPAQRFVSVLCMGLAIWPVRSTFEYGQINLVIMWLVIEDVSGLGRNSRWGGVLTGLAAGLKLTPAAFIPFFLVAGEKRRATTAAVTALGTVVLGAIVQPSSAKTFWTEAMFDSSRVGSQAFVANQSWSGFLHRAFGTSTGTTMVWLAVSAITMVASLYFFRLLWTIGLRLQAVLLAALSALLVSPISWTHHWVWLMIVPVVLLVPLVPSESRRWRMARTSLLVLSFAVSLPRIMTFLPHGGDAEYGYTVSQHVLANAYPILAFLTCVYLAVASIRLTSARRFQEPRSPLGWAAGRPRRTASQVTRGRNPLLRRGISFEGLLKEVRRRRSRAPV